MRLRFNQLPEEAIFTFLNVINVSENLNYSDSVIRSVQKLFNSDIRSMINYIQLNQTLMNNINSSPDKEYDNYYEYNEYDMICLNNISLTSDIKYGFVTCNNITYNYLSPYNNTNQKANFKSQTSAKLEFGIFHFGILTLHFHPHLFLSN